MRISLIVAQQLDETECLRQAARICHGAGARLWVGESLFEESHLALASVLEPGRIPDLGLGVAVAPFRPPLIAASLALSLANAAQTDLRIAYGSGPPHISSQWASKGGAAKQVAAYLEDVRASIRDLSHGQPRAERAALRINLGCGVLRPGMARQAGGGADFCVTWLTSAKHIGASLAPAAAAHAQSNNQKPPAWCAIVPYAPQQPGWDPVQLAYASFGQHVRARHYRDALRRAGIPVGEAWQDTFRAAVAAGLYVYGGKDSLLENLRSYARAGVEEVALHMSAIRALYGLEAYLTAVEATLSDLRELSPQPSRNTHQAEITISAGHRA